MRKGRVITNKAYQAADTSKMNPFSDFIKPVLLAFPEIVGPIYGEINELFGTDHQPPFNE